MTIQATTVRPGFLVSLKTNVSGNVNYSTNTLESAADRARWETTKTIADPVEHDNAIKARSKVRTIVGAICASSSFGYLCPEEKGEELLKAIAEARKVADDFNRTSRFSTVSCSVLIGKIAASDAEAVRAINEEVAELLAGIKDGLGNFDVKKIRDNANKAKELAAMLSDGARASVQRSIDAARKAAREIAAAQKSGETAGLTVDQQTIRLITEERTAFLDLEGDDVTEAPEVVTAAGLDFEPVTVQPVAPTAAPVAMDF